MKYAKHFKLKGSRELLLPTTSVCYQFLDDITSVQVAVGFVTPWYLSNDNYPVEDQGYVGGGLADLDETNSKEVVQLANKLAKDHIRETLVAKHRYVSFEFDIEIDLDRKIRKAVAEVASSF
jgi:hypothetical protein